MRLDKRQIRKIIMEEMSRLAEEMSPFSPEQKDLLIRARGYGNQDFANRLADMMNAKTRERAKDAANRAYRITKMNPYQPELYEIYIEATGLTNFDSGDFKTRQSDPEPPPGYYADQADEYQFHSQIYSKYHRPTAPKPASGSEPRMSGKERLDRGGDLDRFIDRPGALDESVRISQGRLLQIIKEELLREFRDTDGGGQWEPSPDWDDQFKRMQSTNMRDVARKMIDAWGSEDILMMTEILSAEPMDMSGEWTKEKKRRWEDTDRAQEVFEDLLKTVGTGLTIDPEDRRLTPRERQWFRNLVKEIEVQANFMNQIR